MEEDNLWVYFVIGGSDRDLLRDSKGLLFHAFAKAIKQDD